MERIIGDYLDLNYEITQEKINAKKFKFLANIKANKRYKRLIKSAEKIKKSNTYRLNKENLSELFSFISSNHDGVFGCIKKVIVSDNTNSITGMMSSNNYNVSIIINKNEELFEFQAKYIDKNNNEKYYSVSGKDLSYKNNLELDYFMEILNKDLLETLSDYITDYISNFLRKE